jgi:hypothetical protein
MLLLPAPAAAEIQILYQVEDQANRKTGGDTWRYTYTVTGRAFAEFEGFAISFEPDLADSLTLVSYPTPEWDANVAQPEPSFVQPGFLLAQASRNLPASAWQFAVDFVWLGEGTPGPQHYQLFDADLNVLDPPGTLATVAGPIPEPQTYLLMLAGFTLLAALTRRRRIGRGSAWWR